MSMPIYLKLRINNIEKERQITWAINAANSKAMSLLTGNRPFITVEFVYHKEKKLASGHRDIT